ncbi:restriction endonuclease subunit S [Vagococcus luciliae]|uniref:Type I restriction modification DNA specificity domain-containing protein n=1 Tax=Vagococcus luciliae TaxID=2920380 RepID=A0ABY5NZB5_9ENTE|nr:restriction endonuclease subunit S [Vagococcus luciliae]UUV98898.1 hypothetical protein G314FT_10560 [Vagococcus luciliae]
MINKQVPSIRFSGFTDAWEQRKVGDIFDVTRGKVLSSDKISEKCNIEMKYPVYSSQTKNNGLMGYFNEYLFDTAITWTTDGANAGTVNFREGKFYSTNVNGVLLSDKGFANNTIAEILNLEAWKHVSKVGNPKLMNNIMSEIKIHIPKCMQEQTHIGNFFKQLDDTIALHQRELDLLKEQKKGFLQKMFPKKDETVPEIRFEGFTDAWEQRKLEDGVTKVGDGLHGTPKYFDNGGIYFLNGNNIIDGKIKITHETKQVTKEEQSVNDKLLNNKTILMSINGTIGNLAFYNNEPVMLGKSVAYIIVSTYDKYFLYYVLQTNNTLKFFLNHLTGTTIKNLGLKTIRETPIKSPKNVEEQTKIGNFFKQLDDTIALHQRELEELKEMKKGFLQKMFV